MGRPSLGAGVLSEDQRETFVRDGYLLIEDGIDAELIEEGRSLIWDAIPDDPEDPAAWVGVGSRSPDVPADEPFTAINHRLHDYASDLVGDALRRPGGPGTQLALRYPRELRISEHLDRRPVIGHLDGYGPGFKRHGQYSGFTIGGVVYYDQVPERGGGFTIWPGTHWVAADYFTDHALNTPGYGGSLPAIDDDGGWDRRRTIADQVRSKELSGGPGTVILWHNKLVHGTGINQSSSIRMAGITRMSREDHDEIFEDAADKPFEYWDGVDVA